MNMLDKEPPWWWEKVKKQKIRRVSNVAFVSTKTWKILLHKRVKEKYEGVEFWAFFWGRVEKYSDAVETAIKEIKEELGIVLRKNNLTHVCHTETEKGDELIHRDVFLVFTDKEESDFVTLEKKEEDGIYFDFEDAKKLAFRNDISEEIWMVQETVEHLIQHLQFLLDQPIHHVLP